MFVAMNVKAVSESLEARNALCYLVLLILLY